MNPKQRLHDAYVAVWPRIEQYLKSRPELSPPQIIFPHDRYFTSKLKLMVVGQETNGWGNFGVNTLNTLERCYQEFNLGEKYVRSPFWQASRKLACELNSSEPDPYCFAWSNLLKIDRITGKNKAGQNTGTRPEPVDIDWVLSLCLLPLEIRILEPEVVVFFVGPNYCDWMKRTFNDATFGRPTLEQPWSLVKHPDLPPHTYVTYHPGYLWRRKLRGVITEIANQIVECK